MLAAAAIGINARKTLSQWERERERGRGGVWSKMDADGWRRGLRCRFLEIQSYNLYIHNCWMKKRGRGLCQSQLQPCLESFSLSYSLYIHTWDIWTKKERKKTWFKQQIAELQLKLQLVHTPLGEDRGIIVVYNGYNLSYRFTYKLCLQLVRTQLCEEGRGKHGLSYNLIRRSTSCTYTVVACKSLSFSRTLYQTYFRATQRTRLTSVCTFRASVWM